MTPSLPTLDEVKDRLAIVRARIDQVSGGRPVRIVAVTKTWPAELVLVASAAGLTDVGENYAQELVSKAQALGTNSAADNPGVRWHFIGGLQRNKVKLLAGTVDLWQTIDRVSLIDQIAARSPGDAILIQVNTTGEPQKSGCLPDEVGQLIDHARRAELDVRGLMTLGPTGGGNPQRSFAALAQLGDRHGLDELSMGMTGDYEVAVAEGATMVRIGSALFGSRAQ